VTLLLPLLMPQQSLKLRPVQTRGGQLMALEVGELFSLK
jgi:hypothetical protein